MCEQILGFENFMSIPGPKYGNVIFDGFKDIPWDFKAHSVDKNKIDNEKIPTNGYTETSNAINDYGCVGFIIASGESDYDDGLQSFKKWHDILKAELVLMKKKEYKEMLHLDEEKLTLK